MPKSVDTYLEGEKEEGEEEEEKKEEEEEEEWAHKTKCFFFTFIFFRI